MAEVVILQHQELVGPGLLPAVAAELGLATEVRRLDAGDPLPAAHVPGQVLVVLGGTMGVADRHEPAHPWMPPELDLIRARLEREDPVLGLCLGAQMMAHAAGGSVEELRVGEPPRALPEVGCGVVQWRAGAGSGELPAGVDPCHPVFFWHGDRVRLPPEALLLASTLHCREQVFRLGRHGWGIQFHAEITAAMARQWLAASPDLARRAHGSPGIGRIEGDLSLWGAAIERSGAAVLRHVLRVLAIAADA